VTTAGPSGPGGVSRVNGQAEVGDWVERVERADVALFGWTTRQHGPVLDRVLPALSHAANFSLLWLGIAAVLGLSGRPRWRRAAGRGVVAIALASSTANGAAKLSVRRRRPPLDTVPRARRVRRIPVTTSFPSGHSASAAAFATAVALEAPELAAPVGVLAAGVAVSRVWTGAHYPGAAGAGALLGVAAAVVTRRRRRRRRRARLAWRLK